MGCTEGSNASTCVIMSQRAAKSPMRVSRSVYFDLKQLDICYATPKQRGTTGGQCRLRAPNPINSVVNKVVCYSPLVVPVVRGEVGHDYCHVLFVFSFTSSLFSQYVLCL